jgi:[ribosomal protein S18]-alanine N-acetyltransferase
VSENALSGPRPLTSAEEAGLCADMMAESEPWKTLGRDRAGCLRAIQDPQREVFVLSDSSGPAAFVILCLVGAFTGYIQTLCVHPRRRGSGLGSQLIRFSEERIFERFPNVFMCVSSFNVRARDLYLRLGYETVGELRDYVVRGHSEILLRKTRGPSSTFVPPGG